MNTTTNTIVSIHYNIAELLGVFGGWQVMVAQDDTGLYISMTHPEDENNHRGLSLSDEEGGDDLNLYRWRFWNEAEGIWFDSTLDYEAGAEEVLGFLKDCLAEENMPIGVSE